MPPQMIAAQLELEHDVSTDSHHRPRGGLHQDAEVVDSLLAFHRIGRQLPLRSVMKRQRRVERQDERAFELQLVSLDFRGVEYVNEHKAGYAFVGRYTLGTFPGSPATPATTERALLPRSEFRSAGSRASARGSRRCA